MLAQLFIQNIAVIERASLDLDQGFTVLTGETGAGKSIIIDAIHAVLGERTSRELVRSGAQGAFGVRPVYRSGSGNPGPFWTGSPSPGRRTVLSLSSGTSGWRAVPPAS